MRLKTVTSGRCRITSELSSLFTKHSPLTTTWFALLFVLISPLLTNHYPLVCWAQSESATLSGRVTDPSGAAAVGAEVVLTNMDTNVEQRTKSNGEGIYVFAAVQRGRYRVSAGLTGFKTLIKENLVLHVQDEIAENFSLSLGSVSESLTVNADDVHINTQDATVSTVVDRNFAENLPLNGRSFQSLIELAPGVVLTPTSGYDFGQFSVNGQRATSNYWMVDGVSANVGTSGQAFTGSAAGGAVGSFSALGGTNGLVSVDAMQEFRIQTSTYAPEFGRTPGGQISIVTRSGTNQFHGSLFDYVRNDVLDANNWFADHENLPKPGESQNDFGGVLGGPIIKDRTFFFFSYEGLRLQLPEIALTTVPCDSSCAISGNARAMADASVQPYLNAYPKPSPGGTDYGNGIADANYSFSNRATLDAYSIRIDHRLNDKLTLFGRYDNSPSDLLARGTSTSPLSDLFAVGISTQTATLGSTWIITPNITNDVRFNYSRVTGTSASTLDTFGGAVVPSLSSVLPSPFAARDAAFIFGTLDLTQGYLTDGSNATNKQQQLNLVENLSIAKGTHSIKAGIDYRRLFPNVAVHAYSQLDIFGSVEATNCISNPQTCSTLFLDLISAGRNGTVLFQNLGAFIQDTWRFNSRLTLTYGVRWDVDVSPSSTSGPPLQAATDYNLDNLSSLAVAPAGTPVYKTPYNNFAPRLGIAYQVLQNPNWQTVFRGGFGVFYDLVSPEIGSSLGAVYPFDVSSFAFGDTFPLSSMAAAPPSFTLSNFAGGTQAVLFDPNMKLPYTLQWNVSLEQSLGNQQTVSVDYVGAAGRRLVQSAYIPAPNANFVGSVDLIGNATTSAYDALQLQFQRRLSHGLQALASYTWSHSIDEGSLGSYSGGVPSSSTLVPGINPRLNRGPSDFDIRNSFTAGTTYAIPSPKGNVFANAILKGWSTENFILAYSAPPVNIYDSGPGFILFAANTEIRPDIVPGQPFYLFGPQYPGGKAINLSAFVDPPTGQQGDLGRNALRGFGATQWDFAVHRDFPIRESLALQFRAEMFNVLNHPNFGPPVADMSSNLFGLSTETLGQSLDQGSGGAALNPLYQIGGPRSIQFALKLTF
jgi:hypothetical protein